MTSLRTSPGTTGIAEGLKPLIAQGKNVVKRLAAVPIPTLASVNGVAAGAGFSLALACFRSEDALEGLRAFGEKRRPDFKGK